MEKLPITYKISSEKSRRLSKTGPSLKYLKVINIKK